MSDTSPADSHLFTIRLWPNPQAKDGTGWRGQVTHVLSSETRHFREWAALVDFLSVALARATEDPPAPTQSEPDEERNEA